MRSTHLCCLIVACSLTATSFARAEEDPPEKTLSYGAGMIGFLGVNFIDKPSDQGNDRVYPGFGGGSYGGGLMLEGRLLGFVGLEIDIFRSSDHGRGDVKINSVKSNVEIGQSAWHLPILIKGTVPMPVFRPCVFVGPEFVFPGDATASADPAAPSPIGPNVTATVSNYTMLTGGLGFEFKLPISKVDLRIPVSFRGSWHSVGSHLTDRVTYVSNGSVLYSGWKYQAQATLGVSIFF